MKRCSVCKQLSLLFTRMRRSQITRLSKIRFTAKAHTIIDLGDEFFMVGRLHPMIDNDLRIRRMKQEAADPEVGLILFDVVLGEGSHPDPASELAPVIEEIEIEEHRNWNLWQW